MSILNFVIRRMIFVSVLLLVSVSLTLAQVKNQNYEQPAIKKQPVIIEQPLNNKVCATRGWTYNNMKASIGGRVCDAYGCIQHLDNDDMGYEGKAAFDIRGFDTFSMFYGVSDNSQGNIEYDVIITVDENEIINEKVTNNINKPILINITGSRSLLITIRTKPDGYYMRELIFGDPKLIKGKENHKNPPFACCGCGKMYPSQLIFDAHMKTDHPIDVQISSEDVDNLVAGIKKQIEDKPDLKARFARSNLIIMTFSLTGRLSFNVSSNVAENLYTSMAKRGFQPVERGQIDKAMKRIDFYYSGQIDVKTANELSQETGCDLIMIGNISDQKNNIIINARIIDAKTAKVLVAEKVELQRVVIDGE